MELAVLDHLGYNLGEASALVLDAHVLTCSYILQLYVAVMLSIFTHVSQVCSRFLFLVVFTSR
jgi:hypothetical protein